MGNFQLKDNSFDSEPAKNLQLIDYSGKEKLKVVKSIKQEENYREMQLEYGLTIV